MAVSPGPAGRRRRARTPDPAEIAAALERREAAKRAKRGRALDRAAFLSGGRPDVDRRELSEAVARVVAADGPARAGGRRPRNSARRFAAPLAFPAGDVRRWVPIGPSVVRRGQAEGRPRVTGRIRDLAVDATGRRAYAATAKGGVWYTRDGGSTWDPLGGWTSGNRGAAGGLNTPHACGTVMVAFDPGGDETLDLVMVGTGEPAGNAPHESVPVHAGVGVFAARGPAGAAAGVEPWEAETGLALMGGLGIFRLARDPAAVPGKTANPNRDRVVAATSRGLFLGTRTHVPAMGPAPAHDEYRWVALTTGLATLFAAAATPQITDVLWLPGGANGILVVAHRATATTPQGVAVSTNVSTNAGTTFTAVGFGANPPDPRTRTSLAHAAGTNRVYVLGEQTIGGTATPDVWQIPSVAVAAPAATAVGGLPLNLWPNQRDYDQAIAVDVVGANDRIYVGGSVVTPAAGGEWSASLWAFQTPVPPAVPALVPVPGVSGIGAPPAGDGADQAGLIGNNVHGDVHAIRIAGPAAARQVWIGCDGGVFRSDSAGRVNTFQPRHTGLAALEVGFHAPHPTSSHFGAIGCQDNGTQVRVGDTVWEETFVGDGGGVAFHPTRSQYVITQWTSGSWFAQPAAGFFAPMARQQGGGVVTNPAVPGPYDPEDANSAFYSGGATIARTATESRFAIGTDRVWLSDDIGVAAGSTWRVIGFPNGPGSDQAAASSAPTWVGRPQQVGPPAVGAPNFLGPVIRLRWASPTVLLALYQRGIVRYVQTGANWAATILSPGTPGEPTFAARNELFTDIATLPMVGGVASNDFYLVTTGNTGNTATDTCFFYDSTVPQFVATRLRRQLDPSVIVPGPLDPAFAVAVDPTSATDVYVGTVTGVWHATRGAGNVHAWDVGPMANGLPEATVQDLTIWHDAADAAAPRLLRAAVQSRGVWEVDLAAANEARRTYVRVHERDDRRRHPTPMANPRRRPGAPVEQSFASPDIVVRPRWPLAAAPTWRLGPAGSMAGNADRGYQLWTFQTAFRWLYPSIVADGNWTDQLADLVELHRTAVVPALPAGRQIDQPLWNVVVGTTTVNAAGQVNAAAGDPLAVYRPPWHHAGAPAAPATEIDLLETVLPVETRLGGSIWRVYREPLTVDVLLHHRDTRPLPLNDAFAIVLWRSAATQAAALAGNVSGFVAYARSLLTGAPQADPAGWNVATVGGSRVHRLNHVLDARLPKAVSVDIDLTAPAVPDWHRVLIVAIAGSATDALTAAPAGPITTPESLVRNWPHAAMRLVQVRGPRPV